MLEIDRLGEDASHITDFNLHKIGHLSSCTYLNLHCNRLQTLVGLPHCNLTSLTELNLSSNDFSSSCLPELSHLPLLKLLDLSANKLQSVLDLPFLPGLESLIVAHNIISSLDGLNDNVPNLIKLDVSTIYLNDIFDLCTRLRTSTNHTDVSLRKNPNLEMYTFSTYDRSEITY